MPNWPAFLEVADYLLVPPRPGEVTDHSLSEAFSQDLPNVHNAWTHAVPAMVKAAKSRGKKSLLGKDKGAKAMEALMEKMELVIQGLYADGVASMYAENDDILYEIVSSLSLFKKCYPNWQDAYAYGHGLLCAEYGLGLQFVEDVRQRVHTKFGI